MASEQEKIMQKPTEEDKLRAAYALNLCMVSVSQIIDYNDLYVLEQEYDAILNNLNLEQMPKDAAFLNVLKQLLDTITFFRIQEGDKRMLEKEYAHQMKNAIWNAIPSLPVLAVGGSPVTMAISLATAVGTGYMNYRRSKAEANLQKEKERWKLQRAAMEQFNGLRRELFNTAWQIAEKYEFPDAFRLTEKQIDRFNAVLMDGNYIRRYERLETISSQFKAYPPFWYYLANTAAVIGRDERINCSEQLRKYYRQKAIDHYEKFYELNEQFTLLRVDQMTASGAMEYAELLEIDRDSDKIRKLVAMAEKMCDGANDVLQLCATTYLRIGDAEQAARVMRVLVNESYNLDVNATLLSILYVQKMMQSTKADAVSADYAFLQNRADGALLMPTVTSEVELPYAYRQLIDGMVDRVFKKFQIVIGRFALKYAARYNRLIDPFDGSMPDAYYDDADPANREERFGKVCALMDSPKKAALYNRHLSEKSIGIEITAILNEILVNLKHLAFLSDSDRQKIVHVTTNALEIKSASIREMEEKISACGFLEIDFAQMQDLLLKNLLPDPIHMLLDVFCNVLKRCISGYTDSHFLDFAKKLMIIDAEIESFRVENALPEVSFSTSTELPTPEDTPDIPVSVLGEEAEKEAARRECFAAMRQAIEEIQPQLLANGSGKTALLFAGDTPMSKYLRNKDLEKDAKSIVAVLRTKKGNDFAFTLDGLLNCKIKKKMEYVDVDMFGDFFDRYQSDLDASGVNFDTLTELCRMLEEYAARLRRKGEIVEIAAVLNQEKKEARKKVLGTVGIALASAATFGVSGLIVSGVAMGVSAAKNRKKGVHASPSQSRFTDDAQLADHLDNPADNWAVKLPSVSENLPTRKPKVKSNKPQNQKSRHTAS